MLTTVGPSGLRSGSYGSLLLQQQQQSAQPQIVGSGTRKPSKMAPSRERALAGICRLARKRKVGMLLLALVSAFFFISMLSASNKDEDTSEGPGISWSSYSRPLIGSRPILLEPQFLPEKEEKNVTSSHLSPPIHTKSQEFSVLINATVLPSRNPCETFAVPPPPPDSKRTGPRPCEVCYVPAEHALALMPSSPSHSPVLKDLTYYSEENSLRNASNEGLHFAGHPSLQHRNESFNIKKSMTVHCGFFNGGRPGKGSGFDIDEMDILEMEKCHGLVVASAIFGNYDVIQQPRNINEITKRHACFYMFLDEETEAYVKNSTIVEEKHVGLWRVVVVRNLPYADARRNGKVPKLLLHRLFPNARFSLWVDGKLELVVDPFQLLERFLWRKNATFAISRHYRRFDVFEEAEANKAAGKYDNASIDFQVEFYKREGLTHYSQAKLPITSDVPEGCVIIKEHIPITNLFTCLWFNEVDLFTSRDQISFSTVRDKIMSQVNWSIEMFWDCERRNFVVQGYHKDLLDYMKAHPVQMPPRPPTRTEAARKQLPLPRHVIKGDAARKPTRKHGRERKSGSRRRRSRLRNSRDNGSF